MKTIDLSHEIKTEMQIYPGDPEVCITEALCHESDYCHVNKLILGSHTGTHVDAPYHFIPSGKTMSDFQLDTFLGKGIIMDFKDKADNYPISKEDVMLYEDKITPNSIVIVMTGRSNFWGKEEYLKHPFLSKEASAQLVAWKIKIVGIDALSVDSSVSEIFDAHQVFLSNDVLIVENLTNLQFLNDTCDLNHGLFMFIPLKLDGSDGSPIRALYAEKTL